jgi:hypothetical protein
MLIIVFFSCIIHIQVDGRTPHDVVASWFLGGGGGGGGGGGSNAAVTGLTEALRGDSNENVVIENCQFGCNPGCQRFTSFR